MARESHNGELSASRILDFLRSLEPMKHLTRTAWTSTGEQETVAAHSWRVAALAAVVGRHYPELDTHRLLLLCLFHDLGEAVEGDVSAKLQGSGEAKSRREEQAIRQVTSSLEQEDAREIIALWQEYEAAETPEAKLAKALDKIETIVQHNQGSNPRDFDYAFNLDYGKNSTELDSLIRTLRSLADRETQARMAERDERHRNQRKG